jgi:hypothetical protein
MASLVKQLRRADRRTNRAARKVVNTSATTDVLSDFAPDAEARAGETAAKLRERATTVNSVRRAENLNRRAGEIEGALESDVYTRPGGSPRVAALRQLARISKVGARAEAAPERLAAANVRRGAAINTAVRGAVSNRSGTGLGLNLRPTQRAGLRVAANSGTLQQFLDTLRGRSARRFDTLTGMEGARGTIARSLLAADENARRANPNVGRNTNVSYAQPGTDPLGPLGYAAPSSVVPRRSEVFPVA